MLVADIGGGAFQVYIDPAFFIFPAGFGKPLAGLAIATGCQAKAKGQCTHKKDCFHCRRIGYSLKILIMDDKMQAVSATLENPGVNP